MTQYLIAHKCRGEPAFEVAEPMACPLCSGKPDGYSCNECDSGGVWWITHYGHRAYPYYTQPISIALPEMPSNLPEHFEASAAPKGSGKGTNGRDLLLKLGLAKPVESLRRTF